MRRATYKLAVDVTTHGHRAVHGLHIRLLEKDIARLRQPNARTFSHKRLISFSLSCLHSLR